MIVETKRINLNEDFVTEGGAVLKTPVVEYETYGNENGPVVVLAHGGLSSHHAAGKYQESDPMPGWWDDMVGAGKVIDTDKYHVICANALGSMFGTCSPATINPLTGNRYGPTFPEITLEDQVRFLKQFLDQMGVEKIHLMAGPSMGSLQSLQMAALYPDYVGGVVAAATSGRMTPSGMAMHHFIVNCIEMDPGFHGGWYDPDRQPMALRYIHQVMKIYYTHEDIIKIVGWDSIPEGPYAQDKRSAAVNQFLVGTSDTDIAGRDANSYACVVKTINSYDLGRGQESFEKGVQRITCPVLMMNFNTDAEFNIKWAVEVEEALNAVRPGQAKAVELETPWGHIGCVKETDQMAEQIAELMGRIEA